MTQCIAMTGATGFVGQMLLDVAQEQGIAVRALTRRSQPDRPGVTWISGALDTPDALRDLIRGSDGVIHVAGAVNVPTRADFYAANAAGTQAVIDAAQDVGVARFVHVSSLAAREAHLSDYGWSKAEAERIVADSGLDWAIVRPPAIYGPRDTEMRELFIMANRGFMLLPPGGRTSIIHVTDLARLLLALAIAPVGTLDGQGGTARTFEIDDGTPHGLSHAELAQAIGRAVGRKQIRTFAAPRLLLQAAARGDTLLRGDRAKLTLDRARYMAHPDWVVTDGLRPPSTLWTARIPAAQGLAETADWYRAHGHF